MNRIANGGYIEVILTSDIGYTCEEIIDNLLIEGVIPPRVDFFLNCVAQIDQHLAKTMETLAVSLGSSGMGPCPGTKMSAGSASIASSVFSQLHSHR